MAKSKKAGNQENKEMENSETNETNEATGVASNPGEGQPQVVDNAEVASTGGTLNAGVVSLEDIHSRRKQLEEELAFMKEQETKALNQRRQEIEQKRTEIRKLFDEEYAALTKELQSIEEQLGIVSTPDLEAVDVPLGPSTNASATTLSNERPKDVPCSDEFWNRLMRWPFSGNEGPSSLDQYILLVASNASPDPVNIKTLMPAVLAMGHKTRSNDFRASIGTACTRLKADDRLKPAQRGEVKITTKGQREVEKFTKQHAGAASLGKASTNEDFLVKALVLNGGKAKVSDLGKLLVSAGYEFPKEGTVEERKEQFKKVMSDAVKKATEQNIIVYESGASGDSISMTELGKQRAERLQRSSAA